MNPWKWLDNVWFNSTTGEYMSAEAYDDLRCKQIAALEAENERLKNAIMEYGNVHKSYCPQYTGSYELGSACTCGFSKVLARVKDNINA